MKKVISFIASNYRNDKIWLRRTLPSKRDYKILIAIDDSLSMRENNLGFFSLEASVALQEALQRLEVGKVAVARIRDRLELV
jgi:midasin